MPSWKNYGRRSRKNPIQRRRVGGVQAVDPEEAGECARGLRAAEIGRAHV